MSTMNFPHGSRFRNLVIMLKLPSGKKKGLLLIEQSNQYKMHELHFFGKSRAIPVAPLLEFNHVFIALSGSRQMIQLQRLSSSSDKAMVDTLVFDLSLRKNQILSQGTFAFRVHENTRGPAVGMRLDTEAPQDAQSLLGLIRDPMRPSWKLKRLHEALDQISR